MYEYRTGTEPTRVEETPLEFSLLQDDDDVIDDSKADEVSIFKVILSRFSAGELHMEYV